MGCIDKKSIPKKYGIFEIEIKYGRIIMVHSYHSFLSIQCEVGSTYQLMFQEKKLEKKLKHEEMVIIICTYWPFDAKIQ